MPFDLARFAEDPRQALATVGADEVFGFLTRSLVLPAGVACGLVDATGQCTWIHEGRVERGQVVELRFIRRLPLALRFTLADLKAADGHLLTAELALGVALETSAGALDLLIRRLGQNDATADQVRAVVEPAVRAVLAALVEKTPMDQLVVRGPWQADLGAELSRQAFGLGLALADVQVLALTSASYQQQLRQQAQATLETQRLAQRQHLAAAAAQQRASELSAVGDVLGKLKDLTTANPGVAVRDLLQQFAADSRATLYRALLNTPAGAMPATAGLFVLTSQNVLHFATPQADPAPLAVPADLGAFRSLAATPDGWLIGAQHGVWQVDRGFQSRQAFGAAGPRTAKGGFNGAVQIGAFVVATHSELGVWAWADAASAGQCVQPPTGQRMHSPVICGGDRVAWAQHNELWSIGTARPPERLATLPAACTALVAESDRLVAGLETGQIVIVDLAGSPLRTLWPASGRAIRSLAVATLAGLPWLLVTDGLPRLAASALDDPFTTDYRGRLPLRGGTGHALLLAGVDDLRARVVLWAVANPAEPLAVLDIRKHCERSIQDAVLA